MSDYPSQDNKDFALVSRLNQAKWFVDHGFSIIPIDPKSKKPVISQWQKYSHQSLSDEEKKKFLEMIQQGYNYAVPGGQRNLVILDFENTEMLKKLLGGESALNKLCEQTLCVNTPHGGLHVFLQSDEIPPQKFNPVLVTKDGEGIADLQSFNSYVVGVGSCINHKHCTSNKCTKKGQDIIDCYTLYNNELREIGKLNLKEFLKFLAERGKKLGIKLSPSALEWLGESKEESGSDSESVEKKLEKLKKEMEKYDRFKGKTVDTVKKEVCKEMKKTYEALKDRNDKEAERWKAIYGIAIPVVCDDKPYEEVGIDRSKGDWRVIRALLTHGVTNLDMINEFLPANSKMKVNEKWDVKKYQLETLTNAWKKSKPKLRFQKESQGKNEKEKKKIKRMIITQTILEQYKVKTFYQVTGHNQAIIGIFRWDKKKGVFEPFDKEIRKIIRRLAELMEISSLDFRSITRLSKKDVDDIVDEIKDLTLTPLPQEPMRIAFNNATIEWADKGVNIYEDRKMKHYSFYYLPWEIDTDVVRKFAEKDTITAKEIEELAKQISPKALETFTAWADEKWILLYEIIGYTFYPAYKFRKAFMLLGEGRNGKSSYINLVKKILTDYATSISPRELFDAKNRFVVVNLYHKLANAVAESKDYSIDDMDRVKRLTGDDWITADVKFKDPITFKNIAKLIIASNNLPHVRDTNDKAFWHRWVIIEFPHLFPDDNSWFDRTFDVEEINGIVTTAIVSILRAFKQKHLDYEQTEEQVMDIWLSHIDSVYSFIKTYQEKGLITVDPTNADLWIPKTELYDLYKNYCIIEGFRGVSKKAFTKKLREYFHVTVSQKGQYKEYAYVGITLNKSIEELLPPKLNKGDLAKQFEECLGFTLGAMSHDLLKQNVIYEEKLMKYFKGQVNIVEKVGECLEKVGYRRTDGKFVRG